MEIFTKELLIRLITSIFCSIAFAIIFKVDRRHLPYIGICGLLTYFLFHVVIGIGGSVFVAAFASTCFTATYSEICARRMRAPAIIYIFTGVIPTVPGGDLYNAMRALLLTDYPGSLSYLSIAIMTGVGIAGGIVTVSILFGMFSDLVSSVRKKKGCKK